MNSGFRYFVEDKFYELGTFRFKVGIATNFVYLSLKLNHKIHNFISDLFFTNLSTIKFKDPYSLVLKLPILIYLLK